MQTNANQNKLPTPKNNELSPEAKAGLILGTGGVLSALVGGFMERRAADTKANLIEQEGQYAYETYIAEAARTRENANQYQAKQTMKYVMSGVALQGTPMLALEYTSQQSRLEVEALENRAIRTKKLALANALATRQNAIWGSNYRLGEALSKTAMSVYTTGMFDNTNPTPKKTSDPTDNSTRKVEDKFGNKEE